jgi:TRAP-type C4-dicarboxylate transport system permease small subunit
LTEQPSTILTKLANRLTRALEWVLILGVAALTLDVLWGVFSRYILGNQSTWTEPLATTLLVWVSLLGGALAYGERAHLGVDYLVGKLHPDAQRLASVFIQLLVFCFALAVMVWGGCNLVLERLDSGQVVQGLFGLPRGYVYASVPISGLFVALYAITQLVEALGGVGPPRETNPQHATLDDSADA